MDVDIKHWWRIASISEIEDFELAEKSTQALKTS